MTRSTKETYKRLITNLLLEVSVIPKENPEQFKRIKKKLNKYIKRYEAL